MPSLLQHFPSFFITAHFYTRAVSFLSTAPHMRKSLILYRGFYYMHWKILNEEVVYILLSRAVIYNIMVLIESQ